jgi:hypothetical protein
MGCSNSTSSPRNANPNNNKNISNSERQVNPPDDWNQTFGIMKCFPISDDEYTDNIKHVTPNRFGIIIQRLNSNKIDSLLTGSGYSLIARAYVDFFGNSSNRMFVLSYGASSNNLSFQELIEGKFVTKNSKTGSSNNKQFLSMILETINSSVTSAKISAPLIKDWVKEMGFKQNVFQISNSKYSNRQMFYYKDYEMYIERLSDDYANSKKSDRDQFIVSRSKLTNSSNGQVRYFLQTYNPRGGHNNDFSEFFFQSEKSNSLWSGNDDFDVKETWDYVYINFLKEKEQVKHNNKINKNTRQESYEEEENCDEENYDNEENCDNNYENDENYEEEDDYDNEGEENYNQRNNQASKPQKYNRKNPSTTQSIPKPKPITQTKPKPNNNQNNKDAKIYDGKHNVHGIIKADGRVYDDKHNLKEKFEKISGHNVVVDKNHNIEARFENDGRIYKGNNLLGKVMSDGRVFDNRNNLIGNITNGVVYENHTVIGKCGSGNKQQVAYEYFFK